MRLRRLLETLALISALAMVASCSQCDLDCSAAGVSVALDQAGPVEARVCIDDDCVTLGIATGASSIAHEDVKWDQGRTVLVSIELLGPEDQVLGAVSEERTMFDPEQECRCAVFGYRWSDGALTSF